MRLLFEPQDIEKGKHFIINNEVMSVAVEYMNCIDIFYLYSHDSNSILSFESKELLCAYLNSAKSEMALLSYNIIG